MAAKTTENAGMDVVTSSIRPLLKHASRWGASTECRCARGSAYLFVIFAFHEPVERECGVRESTACAHFSSDPDGFHEFLICGAGVFSAVDVAVDTVGALGDVCDGDRSEEHTSELQSRGHLV